MLLGAPLWFLDDDVAVLQYWVSDISDNFDYFKSENSWDAIRSKINEGIKAEKECRNQRTQNYYGEFYWEEVCDGELIISVEDDYDYDYYGRRWATN